MKPAIFRTSRFIWKKLVAVAGRSLTSRFEDVDAAHNHQDDIEHTLDTGDNKQSQAEKDMAEKAVHSAV